MSIEIPTLEEVLEDPASSFWLKATVQSAVARDPVDALNDALVLAALLDARLRLTFELEESI